MPLNPALQGKVCGARFGQEVRVNTLPSPSFTLTATRINPLRGFISPALRLTRINARLDIALQLERRPHGASFKLVPLCR